eukprot:1535113-Pleurochrysis_carterae.AAC.1
MALLAEVKRASPSKGDIAKGADAPATALAYALAGACTISVLTEPHWFKGSLNDLEQASQAPVHQSAIGVGCELILLPSLNCSWSLTCKAASISHSC